MNPNAITFDEIERETSKAKAYALLAGVSVAFPLVAIWMWQVSRNLKKLLKKLNPNNLELLSPEQGESLLQDLRQLHPLMARLSRNVEWFKRIPICGHFAKQIEDRADELFEVMDDLVLMTNRDMKKLIAQCVAKLPTSQENQIAVVQR